MTSTTPRPTLTEMMFWLSIQSTDRELSEVEIETALKVDEWLIRVEEEVRW